jgi:glycosyltransferase involved in cell wall biosynthesis
MLPVLDRLSSIFNIPYTLRTHSFDVLTASADCLRKYAQYINGPNCLKVITFPTWTSKLTGVNTSKVLEFYPSIKIDRYFIPLSQSHGPHIMSGGACLEKKNIFGFIDTASIIRQHFPNKLVTFYTMTEDPKYYNTLMEYNISKGSPVIFKTVQTCKMPTEYLNHTWLIYGACKRLRTVGLPLMVAEAQAAGVAVIMYKLREDMEHYNHAGYFYENPTDICNLIANEPDPSRLQAAQEITQRYNISHSITALETAYGMG